MRTVSHRRGNVVRHKKTGDLTSATGKGDLDGRSTSGAKRPFPQVPMPSIVMVSLTAVAAQR